MLDHRPVVAARRPHCRRLGHRHVAGQFYLKRELPAELARFKPKADEDDDEAKLPCPLRYTEMEAAKEWRYRWPDWLKESPDMRAQMMAHEIHRGLRAAWEREHAAERRKKNGKRSLIDEMRQAMGTDW